jgi:predicted dehydrogenase
LGSIALKHIRVLREIVPRVEIFALRSSGTALPQKGISDLHDWKDIEKHGFHFVLISSPSALHLEHITKITKSKVPIMVEKPLFVSFEQILDFEKLDTSHVLIYVACNFRFHPLIGFIKHYLKKDRSKINEVSAYCGSYLPDWRPGQDYSKVYSSMKEMGGGVHLDLVHEPDYLVYLFGMPSAAQHSGRKVSDLKINSYDSSVNLLRYDGFQAHIMLNYFRRDTKRTLEIVREKDTLLLDFIKGEIHETTTGKLLLRDNEQSVYTTYKRQMEYFLKCIKNDDVPMNSASEAVEILKLVL